MRTIAYVVSWLMTSIGVTIFAYLNYEEGVADGEKKSAASS
jgi:hypothetical protein